MCGIVVLRPHRRCHKECGSGLTPPTQIIETSVGKVAIHGIRTLGLGGSEQQRNPAVQLGSKFFATRVIVSVGLTFAAENR
jgi:hypothetical protein